jgi:hypothetical protein
VRVAWQPWVPARSSPVGTTKGSTNGSGAVASRWAWLRAGSRSGGGGQREVGRGGGAREGGGKPVLRQAGFGG